MTGVRGGVSGVIMADNGQELLILADSSVSEDAQQWTATFQDSGTYTASLKKRDRNSGLAVFSVLRQDIAESTWNSIRVSTLGNSNRSGKGDPVIALGDMFGYADGVGYGVISSVEYKETVMTGAVTFWQQISRSVSDGTGVTRDLVCEVIGMIISSVWDGMETGMANALAISDIKSVIEILANDEYVPYIGIYGTTVTDDLQEQGMPAGVYVVDVDPESPAMEAGIQSGDIICETARENVTSLAGYQSAVLKTKAGDLIRIRGQRRGADGYVDVDFNVTVGNDG